MVFLPGSLSLSLCTPLLTLTYLTSLGLKERESLNGCSLISLPFFINPLLRSFCFSPVPVHYRETTGDHVMKFQSFESVFSRAAWEGTVPPTLGAAWLCTFSLDSTCVEVLTTGQEVLLCCLNAPSFSVVIDFKMPLLPLPGSTGQGTWVGGMLAVLRGRGQIPPRS